jgi:heme-degrading monooxygenase HmoA
MFVATLRRQTTITKPDEFEQRKAALLERLLPYLQKQPGFLSHELTRDGDSGAMVEVTRWTTEDDRRRYLRGGAAAMAATWLDGYLPTAPYPNGAWLREYSTE